MSTTAQKLFSRRARAAYLLLFLIAGLVVAVQVRRTQPVLPPGHTLLAEVDLSSQSHDAATLAHFSLTETAEIGLSFTLRSVNTPYFDLSIEGPEGAHFSVLHGENYRTDRAGGGEWRQSLPPGDYRLVLTAGQSPGILSIYLAR